MIDLEINSTFKGLIAECVCHYIETYKSSPQWVNRYEYNNVEGEETVEWKVKIHAEDERT